MNDEKKANVLYLVIGVTTLIVAIIGATFAFFSASASSSGSTIEGSTNDTIGGALSLQVERVKLNTPSEDSTINDGLVPANIIVSTAGIGGAIDAKCISEGNTGCHLYKITASSSQTVEKASVRLSALTVDATDTDSWKYVIYKSEDGEAGTVSAIVNEGGNSFADFTSSLGKSPNGYDMHNAGLMADEKVYYYLLIYLANKENDIQNPTVSDENDGTGEYEGTVTMDVLGGKVVASFASN